jgi:aldehyde:ferredoxin oxidoreductase
VNLVDEKCDSEQLGMEWDKKHLGLLSLAKEYYAEECDTKVDFLSGDNKLIFTKGPLTCKVILTSGSWTPEGLRSNKTLSCLGF